VQDVVFVIEDDPPGLRRRWWSDGSQFDDVDAAVEWGLRRASMVVVRTLGSERFWAGVDPGNAPDAMNARPWPPPAAERRRIDDEYAAALAAAQASERFAAQYRQRADQWVAEHAPRFRDMAPAYSCTITLPGDGDNSVAFEELTPDGEICGAHHSIEPLMGFGVARVALARASGLDTDDPWIIAATAALAREHDRGWRSRRMMLQVQRGKGGMFHVTSAANRESIAQHGLDWRRMTGRGVAGSIRPELPAVFLCEGEFEIGFFLNMARGESDVWAVWVDDLWLESGPVGWWVVPEPIPPDRLVRLAR
jgi:hypothetical protein